VTLETSIEVWQIPHSLSDETVKRFIECLRPKELERSGEFRFPRDRQRYIVSRGALRFILARYLGDRPECIELGLGEHGKPFLSGPSDRGGLEFNLSHCSDLTVVAAASGRRLGVDVETVRSVPEMAQIANGHFGVEERLFIEAATADERLRRFLMIWTRREAAAKALGLDLSAALTRIDLPVHPAGRSVRLGSEGDWFVADLRLDRAHVGSLCAEGAPCGIVYRDFGESFTA